MVSFDEFRVKLKQLVDKVPDVEDELRASALGRKSRSKPEETTKTRLIAPFLQALGFDEDTITPEFLVGRKGGKSLFSWVDYCLRRSADFSSKGLALVEAKPL